MRTIKYLSTILLLIACSKSFATESWHVVMFGWDELTKDMAVFTAQANEIIDENPRSVKTKEYFQNRLDNVLWNRCFYDQTVRLTPINMQHFYLAKAIAYAKSVQNKAGVKNSFFDNFGSYNPYFKVKGFVKSSKPRDKVFVVPPSEIGKWHAEIREMNSRIKHPAEHLNTLEHLEAVLLLAKSDYFPGTIKNLNEYDPRVALAFCASN